VRLLTEIRATRWFRLRSIHRLGEQMADWNWNPDSFAAIGTVGDFAATA